MDKPILYSTGCPRCRVIKKKLENAGIDYKLIEDVETFRAKGFTAAPVLEISEGEYLTFTKANNWIKEQVSNNEH